MNNELIVFAINLKTCKERRINIEKQLKQINLPYVIIEAVDGKKISQTEKDSLCDYKKIFKRYHRMMTDGEIGCSLSHKKIYQYMIDNNIKKAIICEDDVFFNDNFTKCYNALSQFSKEGYFIKLDSSVEENIPLSFFGAEKINDIILRKNIFQIWLARGYYIDQITAKRILNNHKKLDCIADDFNILLKHTKFRLCYPRSIEDNDSILSTLDHDRNNITKTIESQKKCTFLSSLVLKIQHFLGLFNPFN